MFSVDNFNGFDDAAFLAFDEKKWSSNVFNMERMRVSEQLRLIGDVAEKALKDSDVVFARAITPHNPSVFNGKKVSEMALYFSRTDEQKRAIAPVLDRKLALPDQISDGGEHHRHGFLGVLIKKDRVEVGVMIHSRAWLDVMNLLNRCKEKEEEAGRFVRLLHLLKPGAIVRVAPGREVKCASFDASMIHSIEEAVLNESFTFFVGYSFDPTDKAVQTASFADTAAGLLAGLIDVWKFSAWKPTSNYLVSQTPTASMKNVAVIDDGSVVDFSKGSKVKLTGGIFAGRIGVVQDMDTKGNVKVLVGRVTVRTDSHSVNGV